MCLNTATTVYVVTASAGFAVPNSTLYPTIPRHQNIKILGGSGLKNVLRYNALPILKLPLNYLTLHHGTTKMFRTLKQTIESSCKTTTLNINKLLHSNLLVRKQGSLGRAEFLSPILQHFCQQTDKLFIFLWSYSSSIVLISTSFELFCQL